MPSINIKIPACETCHRDEEVLRQNFGIDPDLQSILVRAGLYAGHLGNEYEDTNVIDAATKLQFVLDGLLAEPMLYIKALLDLGFRYDAVVTELAGFIELLKKYPQAHTIV